MRFSYIDTQGKEIEVDSVESLALRIELGAIKPETRLYDAVADRWAPAEEHPVFRSLSRGEEVAEDEVVHIGAEEEGPPRETGPMEDEDLDDTTRPDASGGSGDALGLDFQVSMIDETSDFDVTPAEGRATDEDIGLPEEIDLPESDPFAAFGDVELEPSEEEAPASAEDIDGGPDEGSEGPPAWASEGDALWEAAPSEKEAASPLDRVPDPTSPDPEDRMPSWADRDDDESRSQEADHPVVEPVEREPERRAPVAPRPAHWDERRIDRQGRNRFLGIASGLLAAVVVGAVAFWVVRGDQAEREAERAVGTPALPAPLHQAMVQVASDAWRDVLDGFRGEVQRSGLPDGPPQVWLEGVYLSTAGDYPGVRRYWRAIRDTVQAFRSTESGRFRASLDRRLAGEREDGGSGGGAGLSAADAARVRGAALMGYLATAPRRDSVYRQILALAAASLELDSFLVEHEDDIAYEPYSAPGVSRDPVLEAVPDDSLLERRMDAGLDRVLSAVSAGGVSRPVTTAAIFDGLLNRLRAVGVVPPPRPATPDSDTR